MSNCECTTCQCGKTVEERKLERIEALWDKYENYLREKYPADEGEEWEFSCPHHKEINEVLKS